MFRGVHTVSLDAKGRVAVPSRYRERLQEICGGRLVMTINPDEPCLWIYAMPEWERIEAALVAVPRHDKVGQRLRRRLMRYASDCSVDGAGRVLVPPMLREFGQFEKSLVLFGMSNKFELWSDVNWASSEAALEAEELDESLASEQTRALVL